VTVPVAFKWKINSAEESRPPNPIAPRRDGRPIRTRTPWRGRRGGGFCWHRACSGLCCTSAAVGCPLACLLACLLLIMSKSLYSIVGSVSSAAKMAAASNYLLRKGFVSRSSPTPAVDVLGPVPGVDVMANMAKRSQGWVKCEDRLPYYRDSSCSCSLPLAPAIDCSAPSSGTPGAPPSAALCSSAHPPPRPSLRAHPGVPPATLARARSLACFLSSPHGKSGARSALARKGAEARFALLALPVPPTSFC
jgi:hypothetical protein